MYYGQARVPTFFKGGLNRNQRGWGREELVREGEILKKKQTHTYIDYKHVSLRTSTKCVPFFLSPFLPPMAN